MLNKTKSWFFISILIITSVPLLAASVSAWTLRWPKCAKGTNIVVNQGAQDKDLYTIYQGTLIVEEDCIFLICGNPGSKHIITIPGVASMAFKDQTGFGQNTFDKKGKREISVTFATDLADFEYCDESGECDYKSEEYKRCCLWDPDCTLDEDCEEDEEDCDSCDPSVAYENATLFSSDDCVNPNWVPLQIRGQCATISGDRWVDCLDPDFGPNETIIIDGVEYKNCPADEPVEKGATWYCATETPFAPAPNEWQCTRPPVTAPDEYTVSADSTTTVRSKKGVLSNDNDPDNEPDALTASLVYSDPFSGTLTLYADGGFEYIPSDGPGVYDFEYVAFDGLAKSEPEELRITVVEE